MTTRAIFEAQLIANHTADDAYASGVIANARALLTPTVTPPPIDYEVAKGGGNSSLCDCVAVSTTLSTSIASGGVASFFITLQDTTTATGDSLFSLKYSSDFEPERLSLLGGIETFTFSNLPAGNYRIYQKIDTQEGAKLVRLIFVSWNGTNITGITNLPQVFNYEKCATSVTSKYEDGVFVGLFNSVTDTAYTPVGTIKTSCTKLPAMDINPDIELTKNEILETHLISLANGIFASTLGNDGTSVNLLLFGDRIKSFSIISLEANSGNSIVGAVADQVLVTTSNGQRALIKGATISFDVEDNNKLNISSVDCVGDSACLITLVLKQ